jgi:hypothetical protein
MVVVLLGAPEVLYLTLCLKVAKVAMQAHLTHLAVVVVAQWPAISYLSQAIPQLQVVM